MLKNTQLVSDEISEDMATAKEELDEAVPFHTLLDVSANRSKAELAHKGVLSQRQRPSTEALRATGLRKSVSTLSSASDSGFPVRINPTNVDQLVDQLNSFQVDSCEDTRENTPDSDSGYVGSVVTVTSTSRTFAFPGQGRLDMGPSAAAAAGPPPPPAASAAAATPLITMGPPKSFLSEMQNVVQRRRGLESSPPSGPTVDNGGQPSNLQSATLADQLRSCLEERRKSKEEEHELRLKY